MLEMAFFFLTGIFIGVWPVHPHFFQIAAFVASALLAAVICYNLRSKSKWLAYPARIFVYFAVFLTGLLLAAWRMNDPAPDYLAALMDQPREGVEIIGVVADDPALRKSRRGDYQYWSFAMRVEAVSRTGAFEKAHGEVLVSMPTNLSAKNLHYGERWKLCGVLIDKARFSDASGMAPVRAHLPYRFLFQVSDLSEPVLLARSSPWSLIYWCYVLRQKCSGILTRGIENKPEVIAILQALVLGRQYELPPPLREAFMATGTYHIFAISGQHVAIIAMFIIVVLQVYGVCRLHWFYYLAPALIVFTIMTGMSTSAVRGCIMAMVCFMGPLFKRKTDIPSAMALAALLILAVDPLQLFQAGFLLSFGIVAGLVVLCPPLIDIVKRKIEPEPWRLEPENTFARKSRQIAAGFVFMVIASFVAWVVSMPLIAYWFNLISFMALPANLLIIPLTAIVLLLGCLSVIFGWCPFLPGIFNMANAFFVSLMAGLTKALSHVPFGHVFVESPPLWFVCSWFGFLIVGRIFYQKKKVWFSAFLIFLIAAVSAWLINRKEWKIHIVNAGGSAVCFVDSAQDSVLINSGPGYQARNVLSYLRRLGVNRLGAFVCPAPDADHCGGAKDLIESLPVGEIILAGTKPNSKTMKALLLWADKKGINVREIKTGENDVSLLCSEHITVYFGAAALAQTPQNMVFRIKKPQFEIIVKEETSSLDTADSSLVSTQPVYRVICRPAAEEREWPPCDFLESLPAIGRVVLGPGQGVMFTPDKNRVKIEAVSLGW